MNWKFDFSPETSAVLNVSELQQCARGSEFHCVKIEHVAGRLTHDGRCALGMISMG